MMRHLLFLTILWALPSAAVAWDFTCSPANVTEIEPDQPPNIMMMLDRSGSMAESPLPNTCRVCETPDGKRFEVASAAECPSGTPWSVSPPRSIIPRNTSTCGYTHTFNLTGLSAATGELVLNATTRGDFGDSSELYNIYINGTHVQQWDPDGSDCSTRSRSWPIDPALVVGGNIEIEFRASGDVCAHCSNVDGASRNYLEIGLTHTPYKYLTSIPDPVCGTRNKWQQALYAIDRVTYESSSRDPDLAAFGLGVFHGSTASVLLECGTDNHTDIMSALGAQSPNGATPTGTAIRTAAASTCFTESLYDYQTDVKTVARYAPISSLVYNHTFTVPPQNTDMTLTMNLQGDYGVDCKFATIRATGGIPERTILLGNHTINRSCTSSQTLTFKVPADMAASGVLKIEVKPRVTGQATTSPPFTCSSTTGGVTTSACNTNRSTATLKSRKAVTRTAATLLINDGAPCCNGDASYVSAVTEACAHKSEGALYVLGLGSGTDQDFNHIVAAAGGTGTCSKGDSRTCTSDAQCSTVGTTCNFKDSNGVGVCLNIYDPCDKPSNYASLRGMCDGAFQSNNSEELLAAIAGITAGLQCMFDVNFEGQKATQVPEDATAEYPYLYVGGRGVPYALPNVNNPAAVPINEGWQFVNPLSRTRVVLSDYYCNLVQKRVINQVTTHIACLCEEETGTVCDVPDWEVRDVCPEGTWVCLEGVDYCEPDPECCIPGRECAVPGQLGVCAEGVTICVDDQEICEQVNFPSTEVCNGLDDDCDGEVDEISGACSVPGASGRCVEGNVTCVGDEEVCQPTYGPMPELCNGLDDDCDGQVDNIFESWRADAGTHTLAASDRPKACNFNNVCMCPDGKTDNHAGYSFQEFVSNWSPVCGCGEGLEGEEPNFTEGPSHNANSESSSTAQPMTGCSTTSGSPIGLLFLLGLGLIRRRR